MSEMPPRPEIPIEEDRALQDHLKDRAQLDPIDIAIEKGRTEELAGDDTYKARTDFLEEEVLPGRLDAAKRYSSDVVTAAVNDATAAGIELNGEYGEMQQLGINTQQMIEAYREAVASKDVDPVDHETGFKIVPREAKRPLDPRKQMVEFKFDGSNSDMLVQLEEVLGADVVHQIAEDLDHARDTFSKIENKVTIQIRTGREHLSDNRYETPQMRVGLKTTGEIMNQLHGSRIIPMDNDTVTYFRDVIERVHSSVDDAEVAA